MRNNLASSLKTLPIAVLIFLALASVAGAQSPVPGFSKSFAPSTIGPGSTSTLTFTISNTGSLPVRDVAFTDSLPAGVTIASPAAATTSCGGSVTAPDGGSTISFASDGIGGSTTCTVTVNVTSSTVGTHTNVSGDLTSSAGNSGSATANLTVATDRPGFTKSFSPSSVSFGGRSTLTFVIDNSANGSPATNLSFTDNLPSGMEVASPSNASTDCPNGVVGATAGGSVVSLSAFGAFLNAGASCTVSVDVIAGSTGVLGNVSGELTSFSGTGTKSSGKASATLTVTIDRLALTKSFVDDPVAPGGTVTLEFTVLNLDRSNSVTDITFTDDLSATLSGLAATSLPANPCGSGSSITGSGFLTFAGGNLGPEGSCTFSVTLAVPAAAASGSYSNTTSTISGDAGGRPVTGSAAADVLFVSPVPILTKSFVDDPVGSGGTVTLEFTITNTSPTSSATNIAFIDELTTILNFPVSVTLPAAGFCGAGSSINLISLGTDRQALSVTGGNLAAGATCTWSVDVAIPIDLSTGLYTNTTSEITATVDGETVTGSAATDDLEIVAAPRLSKTFTDDPVAPGDTVTLEFTLVHDEFAPASATGITFSDDLAATLSGLTATGLPSNDVCGIGSVLSGTTNLLLTGGSLAPGESCTFAVTLQVPTTATSGSHLNTTSSVVASVGGISTTGLAASDSLKVAGLTLTKEFVDDPALPGGTVTLRFTIDNVSPDQDATNIVFTDDLDAEVAGMNAVGLPQSDVCGTGSTLAATSLNTFLSFSGGSLVAGDSCTFDVTLQVPSSTESGSYFNRTSSLQATVGGSTVFFDSASDTLTVNGDLLMIAKEFTDDPVSPGGSVTLRFTLTNLSDTLAISGIAFTDDLDAALSGLASSSGTVNDVCGAGSQVSGTGLLSFTGGSLAAGASCTFDVTLQVPSSVELGSVITNTTSEVTGTVNGVSLTGLPASDDLQIDFVLFTKSFSGAVTAGGMVTLTFNIQNLNATETLADLSFTDDLSGVVAGLAAIGLPEFDVCGEGSELSGTSFLVLTGGSLLPGGSCTFSVDLVVPAAAAAGTYLNTTSDLFQGNLRTASPATATLTVLPAEVDSDGDGVLDGLDVCPGTTIPEGVPTVRLGVNHFALVNGDGIFDTTLPQGNGPRAFFTIEDTAGCSCEQIIVAQGLGNGHVKFGCSLSAMRDWVALVNP